MTLSGDMVGPRAIESGMVAFGRRGKGDSTYIPIDSLADANVLMERKRALGGIIVKSYRQPMRSQRQQLIKAGRDAGVMVDVEGESHFFDKLRRSSTARRTCAQHARRDLLRRCRGAHETRTDRAHPDTGDVVRRADRRELHLPAR